MAIIASADGLGKHFRPGYFGGSTVSLGEVPPVETGGEGPEGPSFVFLPIHVGACLRMEARGGSGRGGTRCLAEVNLELQEAQLWYEGQGETWHVRVWKGWVKPITSEKDRGSNLGRLEARKELTRSRLTVSLKLNLPPKSSQYSPL